MQAEAPASDESGQFVHIDLTQADEQTSFRLLQDAVVPRPVFLISTVSQTGTHNLAPFSYVMPCSTWPPRFAICAFDKADGTPKDTLVNARASGELVINMVGEELLAVANACGAAFPFGISEFEACGVASARVGSSALHVADSPVRFECKYESEASMPGPRGGGGTIMIVSLVHAYVRASHYLGTGALDVENLRPVGRASIDKYLLTDGLFTLARPSTGEAGI